MTQFFDDLEHRDPQEREDSLFDCLRAQIAQAKRETSYFAKLLADVSPAEIKNRTSLAKLPVTRKTELIELQPSELPFAGMTTRPPGAMARIFQSPGPIYDPQSHLPDFWRTARPLFAAGFRRGDIIHNSFAYHFTPAGAMFESGAHALGCAVFPAGTGNTELQARAIADLRPAGYTGTPSFLKTILEKGRELGLNLSGLDKALVTGEALPPSLRDDLGALGVAALQCYGTADAGIIAYESAAREGMILNEAVILELVAPGTGEPVAEGEIGEIVVSVLNPDYPLIRFGTGDLSAILPGQSPCGRTNLRIKGWMGRADQSAKIKGQFVHPAQIAEIVKRHPEVTRARLLVEQEDGRDAMTLKIEASAQDGLADAVADSLQAVTKLRGRIEIHSPDSLPQDGKVIEDRRPLS